MAVEITRTDMSASELRTTAARTKDAKAARRMLAIAPVLDGTDRKTAAEPCGMERQTLRDWVHRYNNDGIAGLSKRYAAGPTPLLNSEQKAELARMVRDEPDLEAGGVVRWRCVDLKRKIEDRFGVVMHERTAGKQLAALGFRRLSVRPMLSLSEDPVGAMNDGLWDVLVHVGRLPHLRITQRKLAPNRRLLVASADYAKRFGLPQGPEDVAGHRVGVVRENRADSSLWPLTGPNGIEMNLRVRPVFGCNDGEVLRAWALDGFGIVERSEWSVSADLRAGRLVRVLPDWSLPDADVVALLNPRAVRSLRIDKFVERLTMEINATPMA